VRFTIHQLIAYLDTQRAPSAGLIGRAQASLGFRVSELFIYFQESSDKPGSSLRDCVRSELRSALLASRMHHQVKAKPSHSASHEYALLMHLHFLCVKMHFVFDCCRQSQLKKFSFINAFLNLPSGSYWLASARKSLYRP
jgi:hypothetical protein